MNKYCHCFCLLSVQRLLGAGNDKTSAAAAAAARQLKLPVAPPVTEHLCPVCGGRFLQPGDLALHIGKIHAIKTEIVDPTADINSPTVDGVSVDGTPSVGLVSGAARDKDTALGLIDNLAVATMTTQLYSAAGHREQPPHDVHTSPALSVK